MSIEILHIRTIGKDKNKLVIKKFINPNYTEDKRSYLKKMEREFNNKTGKYAYDINGYNNDHYSVIRINYKSIFEDQKSMQYELYPVHGNNTQHFKTFKETLDFIRALVNGNVKCHHRCEDCGKTWED